jgi:hypothetical protein
MTSTQRRNAAHARREPRPGVSDLAATAGAVAEINRRLESALSHARALPRRAHIPEQIAGQIEQDLMLVGRLLAEICPGSRVTKNLTWPS